MERLTIKDFDMEVNDAKFMGVLKRPTFMGVLKHPATLCEAMKKLQQMENEEERRNAGQWILENAFGYNFYSCSNCEFNATQDLVRNYKYCPECGSRNIAESEI